MDIKTYIAAALVALTAACSQPATPPADSNTASQESGGGRPAEGGHQQNK
jgi:hypothetical protein